MPLAERSSQADVIPLFAGAQQAESSLAQEARARYLGEMRHGINCLGLSPEKYSEMLGRIADQLEVTVSDLPELPYLPRVNELPENVYRFPVTATARF